MESMDIDYWNDSSDSQMKLMNMMLQLEQLADLSELSPPSDGFSTPSPPAYCSNPMSPASPALLAGPQHPLSFNNGTATQETGLMFGAQPTAFNTTNPPPSLCGGSSLLGHDADPTTAMREVMYRIAAMQPVQIDPDSAKPPKRKNVRISTDPQSVAARHRRERISERMRILQQMVPGGTKMDTASMLDEAIHYVKFLKSQIQTLELAAAGVPQLASGFMSAAGDQYYTGYGQAHQMQDQVPFMNSAYIWNN